MKIQLPDVFTFKDPLSPSVTYTAQRYVINPLDWRVEDEEALDERDVEPRRRARARKGRPARHR